MDTFAVPLMLYILIALGIAATVALGVAFMILGQVVYAFYSKFFAC
jgi:hypothetical protein